MTTSKIRPEIQTVIERIKNFDQVVNGVPHINIEIEETINKGYDPKITISISYE